MVLTIDPGLGSFFNVELSISILVEFLDHLEILSARTTTAAASAARGLSGAIAFRTVALGTISFRTTAAGAFLERSEDEITHLLALGLVQLSIAVGIKAFEHGLTVKRVLPPNTVVL